MQLKVRLVQALPETPKNVTPEVKTVSKPFLHGYALAIYIELSTLYIPYSWLDHV